MIDVVISVSMLNVGYDNVSVNCVMLARPTKSISVLMQTIWRGTRLNPLKPDDYCLVLDLANCIKDTGHHPLERITFNKKKEDKSHKCKKCESKMKLIDRRIEIIDRYEYTIISTYKCDCGYEDTTENIKIVNIELCENCNETFESVKGMSIDKDSKNLSFVLECSNCGHKKPLEKLFIQMMN